MIKRKLIHDMRICGNCEETFPHNWVLKEDHIEEQAPNGHTPMKDLTHVCPPGPYKEIQ